MAWPCRLVYRVTAAWRTGQCFAGVRPELHAAKLAVLDRHAAPCPTVQILSWLAQRIEQLLDRGPYAIKHIRKTRELESAA